MLLKVGQETFSDHMKTLTNQTAFIAFDTKNKNHYEHTSLFLKPKSFIHFITVQE